jgi:hypothetical protein
MSCPRRPTFVHGIGPFTAIETSAAAHDQNSNFIASWTSLGEPLDEITPTVWVPITEPGPPRFVWLNALKNSALNSAARRSLIVVFLMNARSQFCSPGSKRMLRPAVPKRGVPFASACASAVVPKQSVLNHSVIFFGPAPLQMRSGRGDEEFVFE